MLFRSGFKLSPVLWRKVKPALSAGRVQSVAVRLIVEREREVQKFKSEPYYRVNAVFALISENGAATEVKAELDHRFKTHEEVEAFLEKCKDAKFTVEAVTKKPLKRTPAPPFTTSTLQQEAARKLGFTVSQTMMVAQRLYEGGRITYMRTDSVNLSSLCSNASKDEIIKEYAKEYTLPFGAPKNNYAYKFRLLLEKHIADNLTVNDYRSEEHTSELQ